MQMHRQTDQQIDGRTNRWADRQMDQQTDRWRSGELDKEADGHTNRFREDHYPQLLESESDWQRQDSKLFQHALNFP